MDTRDTPFEDKRVDTKMTDYGVAVCNIVSKDSFGYDTKLVYYGTQLEHDAARLKEGDKVIFNGIVDIVDYVWFYEGPIVKLKSGRSCILAFDHDLVICKEPEPR